MIKYTEQLGALRVELVVPTETMSATLCEMTVTSTDSSLYTTLTKSELAEFANRLMTLT